MRPVLGLCTAAALLAAAPSPAAAFSFFGDVLVRVTLPDTDPAWVSYVYPPFVGTYAETGTGSLFGFQAHTERLTPPPGGVSQANADGSAGPDGTVEVDFPVSFIITVTNPTAAAATLAVETLIEVETDLEAPTCLGCTGDATVSALGRILINDQTYAELIGGEAPGSLGLGAFSASDAFDLALGAGATVSFTLFAEVTGEARSGAAIPVPAAAPLLLLGLGALGLAARRRQRPMAR